MQTTNKSQQRILWGLVLLGSCLYLSLIFNNNLWLDEAFSATLVRTDMMGVLKASANDTLPPLYNILNKLMTMVFGYHAYVLKLTSVIPMILSMILGAAMVKKHFGFQPAAIFILCLCGMPRLLYYGVEIRMYSLGLFFVTASGIFAYDFYRTRRRISAVWFTLFSIGAGYTHHFAFVTVGFVYLFLLLAFILKSRERIREWFMILAATIVLYLPCLFITLQQAKKVNGYFSMPSITPSFILKCLRDPFVTEFTPLSLLLLFVFLGVPLLLLIRRREIKQFFPGLLGLLCFYGTLAFGCCASLLFSGNIFSDRYLVPSFGLFWLGFAVFTRDIPKRAFFLLGIVLLLVTGKTYTAQFQSEYKPGVEDMISFFDENVASDDGYLIYEDNYQIEICFRYYFPNLKKYDWKSISDISGDIWYLEVPGYEGHIKEITEHGYTAENQGTFSFDRYSFTLYKLQKTN